MFDEVGTLRCFGKLRHVSVLWKIKNYYKTRRSVGYPFISPEFWFLGAQWYLSIDWNDETKNWISLSLGKDCAEIETHHVDFTLGIQEEDGSVLKSLEFDHVFSVDEVKKWNKFLKLSDLNDVLGSDYTLNVFCNISFRSVKDIACQTDSYEGMEECTVGKEKEEEKPGQEGRTEDLKEALSHTRGVLTLTENLKDMCLNGLYSDITITVKDQEFKAHKSVLAARSPVFASMFKHRLAEEHSDVMNIPDVDPRSFKDFLLFLYTGEIGENSWDNVFDMYKIADKYDFQELKEKYIQFMICHLSVTSFCHVAHLAELHDEHELLKRTTDFFIDNVNLILPTTEWQILKTVNPAFANELLIEMLNKD